MFWAVVSPETVNCWPFRHWSSDHHLEKLYKVKISGFRPASGFTDETTHFAIPPASSYPSFFSGFGNSRNTEYQKQAKGKEERDLPLPANNLKRNSVIRVIDQRLDYDGV